MDGYRARSEPRRAPQQRVKFMEPPVNERSRSNSRNTRARFRADDPRHSRRFADEDFSFGGYYTRPRPRDGGDIPTTARSRAIRPELWINGDQRERGLRSSNYDHLPIENDKYYHDRLPQIDRFPHRQGYTDSNRLTHNEQYPPIREFINSEFKRSQKRRGRGINRRFMRSLPPSGHYGVAADEAPPPYYRSSDFPQRKQNNIDYVQHRERTNSQGRDNMRVDQTEYDEYVQEEGEYGAPEHPRAHNVSYRDMYVDSTRSSLTRGRDSISFDNRVGHDTNNESYYSRDTHFYNNKRDREKRYPPRKKNTEGRGGRSRYFDQPVNEYSKTNYTPAPPRLKTAMKLMYDLIRMVHHLGKITTGVANNSPRSFRRLTQLLIDTVKPALPSRTVMQMLDGNARNWSHTAQQILEEHYNSLIEQTMVELKERTNQTDWPHAFEIASNWAKRNFKNKINLESLKRTEMLFTAEMSGNTDNNGNNDTEQAQQQATPAVVRPRMGVKHVSVQIQTSPGRGQNTPPPPPPPPPNRGDWSFDQEFPPLDPPAMAYTSPSVTPLRPLEPLPPRQPRRIFTELLVDTLITTEPPTTHTVAQPLPANTAEDILTDKAEKVQGSVHNSEQNAEKSSKKHTEKTGPSLTRVDCSPFLYSETSETSDQPIFSEHSRSPFRPQFSLTQFLQVNAEEVEKTTGTPQKEVGPLNTEPEPRTPAGPATAPETPQSIGRPSRHINTTRKLADWSLNLKKKYVIIGDSNVSKIPSFSVTDLQIDSFPGAKFQHAGNLMERATMAMEPELLIFSFGINNRTQRCIVTTIKEIQRMYRMARSRLPHTELYFPLINFSDQLPAEEQTHLTKINEYIRETLNSIVELPSAQFEVERDLIHWTPATARAMLHHWTQNLNF